MFMAHLLFFLLAMSCSVRSATPSEGELLWSPDRHEGWQIAAITQKNDGRLEVYANPALIYQDATTSGPSYNGDFYVEVRYIEILPDLTPAGAATSHGWRDPWRVNSYTQPVFDKGVTRFGIPSHVAVYMNGGTNYLIIITTLKRVTRVSADFDKNVSTTQQRESTN